MIIIFNNIVFFSLRVDAIGGAVIFSYYMVAIYLVCVSVVIWRNGNPLYVNSVALKTPFYILRTLSKNKFFSIEEYETK